MEFEGVSAERSRSFDVAAWMTEWAHGRQSVPQKQLPNDGADLTRSNFRKLQSSSKCKMFNIYLITK